MQRGAPTTLAKLHIPNGGGASTRTIFTIPGFRLFTISGFLVTDYFPPNLLAGIVMLSPCGNDMKNTIGLWNNLAVPITRSKFFWKQMVILDNGGSYKYNDYDKSWL